MEYGHIIWKVDTVTYRITSGVLSKTTETDEGQSLVQKPLPDRNRIIRFKASVS